MDRQPVLIFGTSELAQLNYAFLSDNSPYAPAAFVIDAAHRTATELLGLPVVAFEEVEALYPPRTHAFSLLAGFRDVNRFREARFARIRAMGYRLVSFVHPTAIVSPLATLGEGCHIHENAIIQPFVTLGSDVFVSPATIVAHHAVIGDHAFLGSRATILGDAHVGARCVVGAAATILDNVEVGADCIIGSGAVIAGDIGPGEVHLAPKAEKLARTSAEFAPLLTWTADAKRRRRGVP